MIGLLWLAAFVVAGSAAVGVGWPAYRNQRARRERLLNEQRYLAWRGRAREAAGSPLDAYQESQDRRRLTVAGALGAAALICLVAFFVATV